MKPHVSHKQTRVYYYFRYGGSNRPLKFKLYTNENTD